MSKPIYGIKDIRSNLQARARLKELKNTLEIVELEIIEILKLIPTLKDDLE